MATNPIAPREPEPRPRRALRLSDAMILIVALGAALAWDRGRLRDPKRTTENLVPLRVATSPAWRFVGEVANAAELAAPVLASASLGLLIVRLLRPRPPLGQVARQPGSVACAIACLVVLPASVAALGSQYAATGSLQKAWTRATADLTAENLNLLAAVAGGTVLASWIGLLTSKRWRPEPSWIDRLGRVVGACWIAMIFGGAMQPILQIVRVLF